MKTSLSTAALGIALLTSTVSFAQTPPYEPTWTPASASPGTAVTVGFNDYVIVRSPVVDQTNGDRYAVTFPTADLGLGTFAGTLAVAHTNPIADPNATIDGHPAKLTIEDAWQYQILSAGAEPTFTVNNYFLLTAQIQLGSVTATISDLMKIPDPLGVNPPGTKTSVTMGQGEANAVSYAEWWKYQQSAPLLDAADRWFDYIRVYDFQ